MTLDLRLLLLWLSFVLSTITLTTAVEVAYQGPFTVPGDIVYGCPTLRGVAVTFAAGPSAVTHQVLDALKIRNITAAFFVQGQFAKNYPEIIKRMYNEGHVIGSHSYDHADFVQLYKSQNFSEIERQITATEDVIRDIVGIRPWVFRPPFGSINLDVKDILVKKHGYTIVMWNGGCTDWFYKNVTLVTEQIFRGIGQSGGITCWHDPYPETASGISFFLESHRKGIISFQECMVGGGTAVAVQSQATTTTAIGSVLVALMVLMLCRE